MPSNLPRLLFPYHLITFACMPWDQIFHRAQTSPSNKVAKKLFRDEDTGDDDVAGSGDVDAE
jgi:hypothetical protein